GGRSRTRSGTTPESSSTRSGSPSCTSSPTTSGSTRTGWTSWATDELLPERRGDRGRRRRRTGARLFLLRAPGIESRPNLVFIDMNLTEIHQEIEQASERRTALWHILSQGHDPVAAAELKSLSERLDQLWDEERTLKAELRFGGRDHLVA